jgi:hypothetical protein
LGTLTPNTIKVTMTTTNELEMLFNAAILIWGIGISRQVHRFAV